MLAREAEDFQRGQRRLNTHKYIDGTRPGIADSVSLVLGMHGMYVGVQTTSLSPSKVLRSQQREIVQQQR